MKYQLVSWRNGVVKISVAGVDVAGSTLDDVTHMIKSGTRPFDISFLVPDASDIEDTPKGGRLQLFVLCTSSSFGYDSTPLAS